MKNLKSALKRVIGVQTESGQAIVLIALFMVIMLAMVGVAIDGGGLFLLWRDAQNAADTAALQAAYDKCTSSDTTTWQGVGYEAADINGFDDTDDGDAIGEEYSSANEVTVQETTVDGTTYVQVVIHAQKPAYFIQLVYRGPLEVTAQSMVYCSRAIDFSDLPGAIGLGDCNCPYVDPPNYTGGGEDRFNYSGSDPSFTGGIHSNCDIDVNAGGDGADFIDGDPSATGTVNDHGKGNYEPGGGAENGAQPVMADPLGLDIAMYAPGGEIYDNVAIKHAENADGGGWDYEDNGASNSAYAPPDGIEGLLYVDGWVTLNGLDSIGPNGLTVVATGQIEGIRAKYVSWFYYGWDGENTHDFGVAEEFDSGYWPHLLAFTTMDNRFDCNNPGASNSALVPSHTADNKADDDLDILGVLYAPRGWISWSGNDTDGRGAMIGWSLDFSGSTITWVYEPSMLPPRAPYMNNAR